MTNQTEQNDYSIKLVLTGDSGVGKTKLIARYVNDIFEENSSPTVGLDFALKETIVTGQRVQCQIWDTAGQEKLKAIASAYYKNAHGVVLVFDITNKSSFERIPIWLEEVRNNLEEKVPIILVGNKTDLVTDREVSALEAKSFAEENGFYYMEASAKSNENDCVVLAFDQLIAQVIMKLEERNELMEDNGEVKVQGHNLQPIGDNNQQGATGKKCC